MDPNQQNNPSGVPTDVPVPTPEVTPTPEVPPAAPDITPPPEIPPAPGMAPPPESAPVADNTPPQSAPGSVMTPSPYNAPSRPKLGLVLALAGAVLFIVVLAVVLILMFNGGIRNAEDFKAAVKNKDAINCLLEDKDNNKNSTTLRTTKGWDKVRMSTKTGGEDINMLAIKDDAIYVWNDSMAVKQDYDASMIDYFIEDIAGYEGSDKDDTKFTCPSPDKLDFSVPNKDWDGDSARSSDDTDAYNDSRSSTATTAPSKSEIAINATINDAKNGLNYKATKLVIDAFKIPQSVMDDNYYSSSTKAVAVYVTMTSNDKNFYDIDGSLSFYDRHVGRDTKDIVFDRLFQETSYAFKKAADDAGYNTEGCDKSAKKPGDSVSCWVILLVEAEYTDQITMSNVSFFVEQDEAVFVKLTK
ncbi:hypothetical protein FWF93_01430 [Candidatus Saccharibacteria bacterium]|nr:hypothetical protein [Candidatus Saccharibacteria bacterium]